MFRVLFPLIKSDDNHDELASNLYQIGKIYSRDCLNADDFYLLNLIARCAGAKKNANLLQAYEVLLSMPPKPFQPEANKSSARFFNEKEHPQPTARPTLQASVKEEGSSFIINITKKQ